MRLIAIEGNQQRLDGGALFGNAPKEMWKHWIAPDEKNRLLMSTRAFLLQTESGKNILFEAGIGAFFEPKLKQRYGVVENEHVLLKNLASVGLKEGDIDAIILSHLHFDHAGGLLTPYGKEPGLLFPNAKYYVGKEHWERALKPHRREMASFIPILHELLKKSGRLVLVGEMRHPDFDFDLLFRFSNGHTPGLMLSEIGDGETRYLFVSDLIPGTPWIHLPITMGYDRFPELIVDEKLQLYQEFEGRPLVMLFTHDHQIAAARLKQDSKGKYFGEPCSI